MMKNGMTNSLCLDTTLQRPRYFPRQIMTPTEFTMEQQFFLDKMRRHNRLLHGWGIVCGGRVRQAVDPNGNPVPWTAQIEPGYFLDPVGNEIIINTTVTYDLTQASLNGQAAANGSDPWCSPGMKEPEANQPICIGVRYEECAARPVRVHPVGCGCDDGDCEYSRTNESYVIAGLTELPESYRDMQERPALDDFLRCTEPGPCPPCPSDPWVILACITPSDDGTLEIDCTAYGRYVVSFANYYLVCCQPPDDSEQVLELMERLRLHIDNEGMRILEEEHGGALGAVTALPVIALRGLSAESEAGTRLQAVKIGQIAAMSAEEYDKFIEEKLSGVTTRGFQAREFWVRAREVVFITRAYRMG